MQNIALIILSVLLSSCSATDTPFQISSTFIPEPPVYLGDSFSEIKEKRNIRTEQDLGTYYFENITNPYFRDRVEYTFSSWNNKLEKVVFEKSSEGSPNDSVSHEIINICRQEYGDNFKIYAMPEDTLTYSMTQRPVLIWEKDGAFIEMSYIPESVYENAKQNNKVLNSYIALVISKEMKLFLPKNESTKFTKESLGLVK